jgi:membrane-associated protein
MGISESILAFISSMVPTLQLVAIFLFSFAEGLPVIGSILPGGTIALLAGSLSAAGFFSPVVAFVIIALSSFAGDMTGFFAGKRFRDAGWLKRIVTHEKHQKSWDLFDRHIAIISIFGKLIPVVRSTPSLFAAARGIKTRRYMLYSFLGSVLWAFAGVFAGNILTQYLGDKAIPVILLILVISIIAVGVQQVLKARKK